MLSLFGIGIIRWREGDSDALDNHATARTSRTPCGWASAGIYSGREAFADEVLKIAAWNRVNGHPDGAPVTQVVRSSIRTAVGRTASRRGSDVHRSTRGS